MPPTGPQGNNYYRSREAILLGLVATFLVLGLTTYFARPEYGTNAWDSLYSTFKTNTTPIEESAYSIRPKCPDHCPSDPYVKPGMIYWGEKKEDTRWVPFPVDEYQPDVIYSNENIDSYDHFDVKGALDHAAPQYMLALQNKDEEVMGWARNKTIVVIGSSHDRNNLEQFCVDVGGAEQNWGGHNGGLCHLKWLNFTISNWFLYGMVDSEEYDWFPATEAPPNTFENRIPHSVEELEKRGFPGGHPDLMIVASLFWDEKFFELYNKLRGVHVPNQKGYLYPEIQWHRNRMQKMFVFLREYFRPDLPIMYRARQVRKNTNGYGLLKIFQLDQSSRAVAKKMGVHEFRWGPNLEGYAEYADNDQHFSEGPSTFLFTDMAFFYLKRAITPGCWQCHSSDD